MVEPLLCPYIWMSLSLILVFIGVLSLTFFCAYRSKIHSKPSAVIALLTWNGTIGVTRF